MNASGWGPERRRAAVAITFDNLGEAAALSRGEFPADQPVGEHPSVTRDLPRVLGLLSSFGVPATFFVEGVNAGIYPEALRSIAGAGHEVALHGWRHEAWVELEGDAERALLSRGVDALAGLGLRPVGFRPPGGVVAPSSFGALSASGFTYCSPVGDAVHIRDGMAVLPFRWQLIDAFHYLPHFGDRRQALLGAPGVLSPASLRASVEPALDDTVNRGALLVTLFHPFLVDTDDRVRALTAILAQVRALVDEGAVWCAPMREIAADLLGRS